jgi:hypothetical protein
MPWRVRFHPDFAAEASGFSDTVRVELIASIRLLENFGPTLGRPAADTLKGSRHANMKELRFKADGGVWRIAFAFDPERSGILLVGGDKSGVSSSRFYKGLVSRADARFDQHLKALK